MPYATPLLTVDQFGSRTIMPAADLRRLQGIQWKKVAPDSAPGLALSETTIGVWNNDGTVEEVIFVPASSLAADMSDYAILSVLDRTGGATPVTVAALATTDLSWSQGVPVVIPIVADAIASGDALSVAIAQSGAGVIVPAGEIFVVICPNFVTVTIDDRTDEIISRLAKRYPPPTTELPWPNPVANLVQRWCAQLVQRDCFAKRGWSPLSESDKADVIDAADKADAQIQQAADGQNGLFELALADDGNQSVADGSPLFYAEASPYTAERRQRRFGGREDDFGGGSPT
jgi:hypothetical protein